jgi:hypothetical protein
MLATAAQVRLSAFRESTRAIREGCLRRVQGDLMDGGTRLIGGGAPTLQVTLGVTYLAVTNNTFTGPQSLIEADGRGPFSMDYFNRPGALWEQEAMGTLGVAAATTPTIVFGSYFGNVSGTITTALAVTAAITSGSGQVNSDWYYFVIGRTVAANVASSTMLVTGYLVSNIAATATVVTQMAKNAAPPTAVTVDMSGGAVFLDFKGTFSASSATNTATVNFYRLSSLIN